MGFTDKLKKAKDKSGDAFAALKQKWSDKTAPPKKDLLEGMVDTSGFYKNIAEEHDKAEYGRGGKELSPFGKMKVSLGKTKQKYNEWSKKRSEEVKKGPTSGQKEEHAGKETKEEKDKDKTKTVPIVVLGLSIAGIIVSWFFEMPFLSILAFAALIVVSIVAFNLPRWFGLILPFLLISVLILLVNAGQYEKITKHPLVAVYVQEIDKQVQVIKTEATKLFKTIDCYRKITPTDVDACLKAIEEEEKEGGEYFDKTYETLEIKPGNPFKEYEQTQPDNSGGEYFDWEVTLINNNEKLFNITVTKINAWTNYVDQPEKTITITEKDMPIEFPYNLQPTKNLYLRISFSPDDPNAVNDLIFKGCDSKTFKMNITSRHNGGTDSWFGMAPNVDDLAWQKFVQGYDPKYEPDPGPLDIFAFTYPFGIDQDYYKSHPDKTKLIIKLRNPKADGTIYIEKFFFIQNFKFPEKYFDIDVTSCMPKKVGNITITYTKAGTGNSEIDEKCQDYPDFNNCFMVTYDSPGLKISQNEIKEIKCNINVSGDNLLTDEYEDLMRVYASYNFIQEYEQTLACIGESSVGGTGTGGGSGTGTGEGTGAKPACSCDDANAGCADTNCQGCIVCKDEDSKGVCDHGIWTATPFDQAPCCEDQDCQSFCIQIYPEATCYYPGNPTCDTIYFFCNQLAAPNKLCGSTIEECEQRCTSTGCT